MINLVTVGLYSNYYLIINAVQTVFTQVITSLTPGVGNLLVDGNYFDTYILKHTFTFDGTFNSVIEAPSMSKTQVVSHILHNCVKHSAHYFDYFWHHSCFYTSSQ